MKLQTWNVFSMEDNKVTQIEALDAEHAVMQAFLKLHGFVAAKNAVVHHSERCVFIRDESDTHNYGAFRDNRKFQ